MAAKLGLEVEFMPSDWRHGADPEAIEKRLRADTDKRIKAVCVVHNETSTGVTSESRGAKGDRRGEAPGALHGGHDLVARLDRLSSRRMGRRRHRRRLAEGPDAAAGPVVQLHLAERRSPRPRRPSCPQLLGVGRDDRQRQDRLLPVHAGDQPALRPARSAEDAARRGRPRRGVRPPPAARGSDAARGARLGAGDLRARPARVFQAR